MTFTFLELMLILMIRPKVRKNHLGKQPSKKQETKSAYYYS
jgi:hypothetical protein